MLAPGEAVVARSSEDVLRALRLSEDDRLTIGRAGQRRILAQHTARHRAQELEDYLAALLPARTGPRRQQTARAAALDRPQA